MSNADQKAAAERFQTALALFDFGEAMLRQRLRRSHPHASDAELDALVTKWLQRRPGAEHGDGEGHVIEWPRRQT